MSVKIIQERLDSYEAKSDQEELNAVKEITQEVALAALSRAQFFKNAAFQGDTGLRILYGLDRFSEDLDFILIQPNSQFRMDGFTDAIKKEFLIYGYHIEIQDRSKVNLPVKKMFLKDESIGKLLLLKHSVRTRNEIQIKVKIEVDTNPPAGGGTEVKYLDFPFSFAVVVQDLPTLFASKCHALLCRDYVKGRDWYDFLWYVSRKTKINFKFLSNALYQFGPWKGQLVSTDKDWILSELEKKIRSLDWENVARDVSRFLKPRQAETLQIWGVDFFLDRLEKLKETL